MDLVLRRVHLWTAFFIVGLVLSGATAMPIPTQLELAIRVLGEDLRAGGLIDASFGIVGFVPMWLCDRWIRTIEPGS